MLPFIQLDSDFVTTKALSASLKLKVSRHEVIGMATDLITYAIQMTSTDEKPPDGIFIDPDAGSDFEAVMGWSGEPGRVVVEFERIGLLQKLGVGFRVRGMKRYARAWEKNSRPGPTVRQKSGKSPARNDAKSGKSPAEKVPGDVDRDVDVEEKNNNQVAESPENLQALWNEVADPKLPRWRDLTEARRESAKARLSEHSLADYREIIRRISASDFCKGKNDRGWLADAEFLLRPGTATKVLEGKYDNRKATGPPKGAVSAADKDWSEPPKVTADGTELVL